MAKWEIIEDKKLKKQTGGKAAATRTIASNSKPVVIQKQKPISTYIANIDKPVYTSVADYTNKRYGAPSIIPQFGQSVQVANFEGDKQPFYEDIATDEYKAYIKDYEQEKINDQVSQFLKANPIPKTNKEKADYIKKLSPYDRQLIQSSSLSNEFLPAFRQYDNQIGEDAKKYTTADLLSDPTKFSEVTKAGLNRFRFFPNATNSYEDLINPGLWFGQMEQGVGDIPKNIKEKNYLAATMGAVNPLLMGRAIGSGSINPLGKSFWTNEVSNAQFINNLVNPLAGIVDANTVKGLGNKAVDKYIGSSFTPELNNVGVEAFGAVKPSTLKINSSINAVEPQTSFFSRNPSVFTNRTIPQENANLSRREIFNRISQRQPTARRVYTLGNEEDLARFNLNNNSVPPPPSEYETARNLVGVNFSEADLNNMNIRDIARGINNNINTSSNISRIDLDALVPYKDLTYNELVIKNPSLAQKLKNIYSDIKLGMQNAVNKTAEKASEVNKKLGQIIEPLPIINENKFQQDLAERLNKGVGIKKGNTQISLKQSYPELDPYNYDVYIKPSDATDFIKSGRIQLSPQINQRSFTDILLNKNKYQGLKKPWDFPLENLERKPEFNLDLPEYKGISAEIGEATKQALKEQNKKLDLLSSKSHTPQGGTRYLTEFLNGRKPAIDVSQNKQWLAMATELKNSLKGKSISKEEVKKILAGNKYKTNQEEYAIIQNPLFPSKVQFKYKKGGIIEDPMGQWAHPGSVTRIPSNQITMQGVNYPVLGVSDKGHTQMMYPGLNYSFKGNSVTEYPMMANGGEVNFTYAGENHRVYEKQSPTGNGKGIKGHIMVNHPTENKGKWDTIDLTAITNGKVKTVAQGVASTKKWHDENPEYANGGKISSWKIIEDVPQFQGGGKAYALIKPVSNNTNVPKPIINNTNSVEPVTIESEPNLLSGVEVVDYLEPNRIKQQKDIIQATKPRHNYAIVDKVANKIYYYDPSGKIIKSEPVITGKSNNDVDKGLSMKDWFKQTGSSSHEDYFKYLEENKYQTTPSGIFTISGLRNDTASDPSKLGKFINFFRPKRAKEIYDARIRDYGEKQKMFTITDEQNKGSSKAIHGTANPVREKAFAENNSTGENRNLSNGCINVNGETICFETLEKKSKMYILPEENTNLLYPKLKNKLFQKQNNENLEPYKMANAYKNGGNISNWEILEELPKAQAGITTNPPITTSPHSPGTVSYLTPLFKTISNPYLKKQEEIIPMNVMGLETLIPSQTMQKVPVPNPITSIPKDYYTIKTGSSYRNPETGAFQQKTFKIDRITGKRLTEPSFKSGGKVNTEWEIIEDSDELDEFKHGGKTPVWQRKEGKSPTGGLNAKGRASLKKEGHDIKPPQPQGGSRKKSFCARMTGLKKKLTGSKKANDPNSRVNLSLKKWKC